MGLWLGGGCHDLCGIDVVMTCVFDAMAMVLMMNMKIEWSTMDPAISLMRRASESTCRILKPSSWMEQGKNTTQPRKRSLLLLKSALYLLSLMRASFFKRSSSPSYVTPIQAKETRGGLE